MDQLETQPWQFASDSITLGELACRIFWGLWWIRENLGRHGAYDPWGYAFAVSKIKFPHLDAGRISRERHSQRTSRQEVPHILCMQICWCIFLHEYILHQWKFNTSRSALVVLMAGRPGLLYMSKFKTHDTSLNCWTLERTLTNYTRSSTKLWRMRLESHPFKVLISPLLHIYIYMFSLLMKGRFHCV